MTSVSSMQSSGSSVRKRGLSSPANPSSGSEPTQNFPPGTSSMPVGQLEAGCAGASVLFGETAAGIAEPSLRGVDDADAVADALGDALAIGRGGDQLGIRCSAHEPPLDENPGNGNVFDHDEPGAFHPAIELGHISEHGVIDRGGENQAGGIDRAPRCR